MKRCLLLFIFWLSVLGGSLLGSTRGEEYEDIRGRIDLLTGHDEDALAAVVCPYQFIIASLSPVQGQRGAFFCFFRNRSPTDGFPLSSGLR